MMRPRSSSSGRHQPARGLSSESSRRGRPAPRAVPSRWIGTIAAVSANQNAKAGQTLPLSGIGRRQDDVERADPVGRDEQQPAPSSAYQVAHLARAEE